VVGRSTGSLDTCRMAQLTASRVAVSRALAAVLSLLFLSFAALGVSGIVESPADLTAIAIVIIGFGIGFPLLIYARGRERLTEVFPRSLVVVTYAYGVIATLAVFSYAIVSAFQYGHPLMGLYFGMFSSIWAALAYGLVVLPIWGVVYLIVKAFRGLTKSAGV
jgi:hypothetical protein